MNPQRAKEITESADMVHVVYNGVSVYIQHIDEQTETARIYPLDEPSNEQSVPLSSLKEK